MTEALNIYADGTNKDDLVEVKAGIIESVQKGTLATKLKSQVGSGSAAAGSKVYDRFKNAASNAYGTARAAGQGEALRNTGKVTNLINDRQEIVEEYEEDDLARYGIVEASKRRAINMASAMQRYLDRKFFEKAEAVATKITSLTTALPIQETLEKVIETLETVENDWVDGVPRELIALSVTPAIYGKLANYLNEVKNAITGEAEIKFNGNVTIHSNHRQTADIVAMATGAVAQDVIVYDFNPRGIPHSNAIENSLFYTQGTEAVMPDLIFKATIAEAE